MTANLVLRLPSRRFRPSLLATGIMVALVPLFVSLGNWQYGKAQDKIARQTALEQRLAGPVVDVTKSDPSLREIEYRPVRLHGDWDLGAAFLLDNQVVDERAGYSAIAPFRLQGGGVVLVNRGWVAAPADRRQVPEVVTPVSPSPTAGAASGAGIGAAGAPMTVKGLAVALPRPGLHLAGARNDGAVHASLDPGTLAAQLHAPVADWMLVLDPDAPGALRVQWPQPAERVQTNLGYAYQWFGFAVAAIGIWIWQGLRRAREADPR